MTYPLGLDLRGRRVLVVGGGALASRRVGSLLDEGADVVLVAPRALPELEELAAAGRLDWRRRGFEEEDLEAAWLVLAHTDSAQVQDAVAEAAERRRIFCVKGGDAGRASAHVPARASAHGVSVAVNAGRDPRRAREVAAWVAAALESGEAPVEPRRADAAAPPGRQAPGSVALVGGGPGEAGLLTVRGRYLLAGADVIVADRLGPREVLGRLKEGVRVVEVGKTAGFHPVPQERINEILVEEARAGARVVRLKGGDPYVLGRGAEEEQHCAAHGIPVEVVPGVTSAVSVPAAAGIPVTHRGLAHGFSVVTAHDQIEQVPSSVEHTLVLLMGVSKLELTAARLMEAGRGPEVPVAIVERGWTPRQRVTVGTLGDIAERARARGVAAPAVIVVGDVARLARTGEGPDGGAAAAARELSLS
ncbi:uroporphyrinogen-III C-methyltransferase [Rothia halotolerans]|uniref:uroporphyrinogen-III C-methyltransferase n=1 Tax=Rothia halotolerans TaxID=405770 RepID=UPI00101C75D4|nr:uroporphyrinogen-III C-methyltransferase [Rothia halotolerans]